MGATSIPWTDYTLNLVGGCSIHSPGCNLCYAQDLAGTRLVSHPMYAGITDKMKGRPIFNGVMTEARADVSVWNWPLHMRGTRKPRLGPGKPSMVFVADMADLFHENRPRDVIDKVVARCGFGFFIAQFLTKRAAIMTEYFLDPGVRGRLDKIMDAIAPAHWCAREIEHWPPSFFWLMFSAERQVEFDQRWALVRRLADAGFLIGVSIEPQLGPIVLPDDFLRWGSVNRAWVICGGESGRKDRARPFRLDWARMLLAQCRSTGVPFFMKQLGVNPVEDLGGSIDFKPSGKSETPAGWPGDLRVREFPRVTAMNGMGWA